MTDYNIKIKEIENSEEQGDLSIDEANELLSDLLLANLQDYFKGKYFTFKGMEIRVADHPIKSGLRKCCPDFSFVITYKGGVKSTATNEYMISPWESLIDAINFITKTIKTKKNLKHY